MRACVYYTKKGDLCIQVSIVLVVRVQISIVIEMLLLLPIATEHQQSSYCFFFLSSHHITTHRTSHITLSAIVDVTFQYKQIFMCTQMQCVCI